MKRPLAPRSSDEGRSSIFSLLLLASAGIGALALVLRRIGRSAGNTNGHTRAIAQTPIAEMVRADHDLPVQTAPAPEIIQVAYVPNEVPPPSLQIPATVSPPAAKPARPKVAVRITSKPTTKPAQRLTIRDVVVRGWPLAVAIMVLFVLLVMLVNASTARNDGHLIYDLDDPYIHMAMARHFSEHGLWSVTRFEAFTSSTSSPLWTLLLALVYWIFGVSDAAPFVLNTICAVLLLVTTHLILDRHKVSTFYSLLVLLALVFFVPLPNLIFTGMEHTLQIVLDLLFIYTAAGLLCLNENQTPRRVITDLSGRLLILALLLPMIRYEGGFIIAFTCALFLARGRWVYALLLGVIGALPIIFYGFFSVVNGSDWLPNSLLLKVLPQDFATLDSIIMFLGLTGALRSYYTYPPLLTMTIGLVVLLFASFARRKTLWEESNLMLLILIPTLVLHMQFAGVGWFFRYEAYLVALGVIAGALSLRGFFPAQFEAWMQRRNALRFAAMFGLLGVLLLPLLYRVQEVMPKIVPATTNIYEQQYQMGTFLSEFYEGQRVALNDIGATTYLADIRLIDMYGLGTYEVAAAKLNAVFDVDYIYRLNRESDTQIAIIYDTWFPILPEQWSRVGQWTIQGNIAAASPTVSFYAVDPGARSALINNLREFAPRLPASVNQTGVYMQGPA